MTAVARQRSWQLAVIMASKLAIDHGFAMIIGEVLVGLES